MAATHVRFGHAVLIDCHSMPDNVRVGSSGMRPDFIIGDRYGTSASGDLTALACSILSGMGYHVLRNKPYAGGFITEHYGRPGKGLHALQIEINRGLYAEEQAYAKNRHFDSVVADIEHFVAMMIDVVMQQYEDRRPGRRTGRRSLGKCLAVPAWRFRSRWPDRLSTPVVHTV